MKLVYNDKDHSYYLNGKRVKSASKVAGITADQFNIEQWRDRMVAIGMTLEPKLAERVAVDLDNKKAIQEVADDAKKAARANDAANRGTQRHRVLELLLLGRTDMFITDQQKADAEVLQRTLDRYGLEPIADRVEQFIAWPDNWVVGRYDALLGHEGRPVLTDLKGGINAIRYPHSTATQLALYAFAPHTSAVIERDGDKSTVNQWTTMPDDLDTEVAYVIHCDDEAEVGDLYRVNLQHGLKGARLALSIVDWRKKHYARIDGYSQPTEEFVTKIEPQSSPAQPTLRELAASMPSLNRATNEPPRKPDEGCEVSDADVAALKARYGKLGDAAKAWTGAVVAQGNSGHTWRINEGRPTVRRFELYRGVLALAEWFQLSDSETVYAGTTDDAVRAIVHYVTDDETALFPTTSPGLALGTLDVGRAAKFAAVATDLTQDRYLLIYREDGTPSVQPAA